MVSLPNLREMKPYHDNEDDESDVAAMLRLRERKHRQNRNYYENTYKGSELYETNKVKQRERYKNDQEYRKYKARKRNERYHRNKERNG